MFRMKILTLILLLTVFAVGQKLPKEFAIGYDKFTDETDVSFIDLSVLSPSLMQSAGFRHPVKRSKTTSTNFCHF